MCVCAWMDEQRFYHCILVGERVCAWTDELFYHCMLVGECVWMDEMRFYHCNCMLVTECVRGWMN